MATVGKTTEASTSVEGTTSEASTSEASISEGTTRDEGLSIMATVGIVVGCILGVVLLLIAAGFICCKMRSKDEDSYDEERVREKLQNKQCQC